jgi:hypothetical protein
MIEKEVDCVVGLVAEITLTVNKVAQFESRKVSGTANLQTSGPAATPACSFLKMEPRAPLRQS